MDLLLLGQLDARDGGRALDLGPRKQRAVLARLAVEPNRTVSVERLLDDLWEGDLPRSAPKMLQIYVSQLRKVLPEGRLRTDGAGYRLVLMDGERDVDRVEALRREAREALAGADPAAAADRLSVALGLWRGTSLGDLTEPFADGERARLEELRLRCREDRIDAMLAMGGAAEVIGELEALVAEHPRRERPRAQLMLALYRDGRQTEALDVYHAFRRTLDEELGLEPSAALRDLEAAIIRQDRALNAAAPAPAAAAPRLALPGRDAERERLATAYADAAAGRRRTVFVTGEPGVGKTALVEALLGDAAGAWTGRGQCVEAAGAAEAYLPVLDALAELAARTEAAAVLVAVAPSWAVHLGADVGTRAAGATAQRMVREAAHVLEALADHAPVVLVLEDLQWADEATVELLAALVRRSRAARLLVVGTCRVAAGPAAELLDLAQGGRLAEVLELAPLDAAAVAALLAQRAGGERVSPALAGVLHERSGGNPLFAGLVIDDWMAAGALEVDAGTVRPASDIGELAVTVPPSIRAALEAQLSRLEPADVALLEAAALAGDPFTVVEVAAAQAVDVDAARTRLDHVAAGGRLIDRCGPGAYAFAHELHRDVLARRPDADRRALLHRRLGAHLEASPEAPQHAARIALHLIEGGDAIGAVRHLRRGAERAVARRAYSVGERLLRRALDLLPTTPEGPARVRAELEVLTALGQAVVGRAGWTAPEAERALVQARAVAERLEDNEPLLTVLLALATLYEVRGDVRRAGVAADELLAIAPGGVPGQVVESQELLACNLFHRGAFVRALEHADRGVSAFDQHGDTVYATFPSTLGDHAAVGCLDWAGLALWFLGFPDQALERARRALALAEQPVRRYSYAAACAQLAEVHVCRDEVHEAHRWAQETVDAATEAGYAYRAAVGRVLRGWARVRLGERHTGIDDLVSGLAQCRTTGVGLDDTLHLGLLAGAYLHLGDPQAALGALDEALALAAREHAAFYAPELLRLRAEALDRTGAPPTAVQEALDGALEGARRHGARSLVLRAAVTQAVLWSRAGRGAAGRAVVADALAGFTEGHDTPDLRAAAALLGREPAGRPAA